MIQQSEIDSLQAESKESLSFSDAPELVLEDDEDIENNNVLQMENTLGSDATTELSTNSELKASPLESPEQQFSTGVHYIKAHNNHYLGAKWFRKAGMQGHAKAQFYLGIMFIKGEGVPKSLFHAYCWLSLASCQNYEEAKVARKNLEPFLTAAEMNSALRLAADRIEQIFET